MNTIKLQGIIKDITFSHYVQDIEYYKANLLVRRLNNKEDIVPIKFKRFCNIYKEGDFIKIDGNVRSYFNKELAPRNQLYVFTYLDEPEDCDERKRNLVEMDGVILNKKELKKTKKGLDYIEFTLLNQLDKDNEHMKVFAPMVAWGKVAKIINKKVKGDPLHIMGHFSSKAHKVFKKDGFDFSIGYEINVEELVEIDK